MLHFNFWFKKTMLLEQENFLEFHLCLHSVSINFKNIIFTTLQLIERLQFSAFI